MHFVSGVTSRFALSALVLGVGLLAQTLAHAGPLTPPVGTYADTALLGTTVAARPELAGTVLEDVITPFSFNGVSGTVQNRVTRETGTGTLDFSWKINVTSSASGLGVGAFRLADFGYANLKDADWRMDGLGTVAPNTARLFNETSYPAGDINFLFDSGIASGASSRFFFLHTDATSYAKTANYDLLTTGPQNLSGTFATFAPSAVPEPSSYTMAGVGLGLVGLMLGRRRATTAA